ncbi:hypothetical protein QAD02_006059 [Eretmocerus hayati]|uniref:Uncharacterized protein n=1 Tax=Eretmocerus hayati TaxID=131215 RepID=A0ACC2N037_9HYME|nr:hypothetical protein QAD02_006059 [Eretmocerus hayati]
MLNEMDHSLGERLLELLSALPQEVATTDQDRSSEGTAPDDTHFQLARVLYQEDPAVVAAAAAAAAVKFRSNYLPPIGVFWDIENCQVPKGRSAAAVTRVIRDKFFNGYKEAEFIVVCDVQKENKQIVQELNDAQVDLIHVAATCKNAADEKLRQSIRRFADTHGSPAAIILISGDINFAADLSDLRHRKKMHVILLHKENTSEALIMCANEHYDFTELLQPLPPRTPTKGTDVHDVFVYNLPDDKDVVGIRRRLKQLSSNCGGRVVQIKQNGAVVRFSSKELAERAQKRMNGELVFDQKILVVKERESKFNFGKNQVNTPVRESISSESDTGKNSTNEMYGVGSSITARSLPGTPHYPTASPATGNYSSWNGMHCVPHGFYPSHPSYIRPYIHNDSSRAYSEHNRSQSPQVWAMSNNQPQPRYWDDRCKIPAVPMRAGPYSQQPDWNPPRPPWPVASNHNGPSYNQAHKRRSPSPIFTSQTQDKNHRNNQGHNVNKRRSDRTPSPYDLAPVPNNVQRTNRISPFRQSDTESEEVENFFNPIGSRNSNGMHNGYSAPIELQVTNLDQNIEPKDMQRLLTNVFMEHVMVLQVSIFMQSDGNFAATVKVPSLSDAQYAISQLHRRKVGYKRILISYVHTSGPNPQIVRSQIVMLLQEVPGHKLPLFKFREMYESRFMISISISELYKMKDVCIITEDPSGRMVSLNPDHRNTPSPCLNATMDPQNLELPYCTIHAQKPWTNKGWAEQEMASLPDVKISLKVLTERVHKLVTSHSGSLPLPSFPSCYEDEFKEPLLVDENGVPLEHLVSCITTVELKQGIGSVKHIVWASTMNHDDSHDANTTTSENKCISPPLASQLALFSRELVDLLKTAPHCQLSFNRFIPAYHHHFGRQCRVADYGFTKLIDLLEALAHTVQVMGEGNKRVVTLSHRAQIRRFTSDLLRILKAQASKQVTLSEFPSIYARVIGKPWDVSDYGVCELDDILCEVSENTVVVTSCNSGKDRLIAIPKREQTAEEIERTRQFATEVIELLKHAPQQRMLFNKFVPSYHHHFGHQCRVADYGFTKLIELFEAIPDIVKIEEVNGGERRISLTEPEGLRVLGEQITKLIVHFGNPVNGQLMISNIGQSFLQKFGYALRPELFNCNSMLQLMEKLENTIKILNTRNGAAIVAIDKSHVQHLGLECRKILMDAPNHCMPVTKFKQCYEQYYHKKCAIEKYSQNLEPFIRIFTTKNESFIELTQLQRFACNVQRVLIFHGGKINMSQFESAYLKMIGVACRAAEYGYPTLYALFRAIPCTVSVKDVKHRRKMIVLNKKLSAVGLLPSTFSPTPSTIHDTDSSNDSIENDFMTNVAPIVSNASSQANDQARWEASKNISWSEDISKWEKSNHWSLMSNDDVQKWHGVPSQSKSFLDGLEKVTTNFPPPPKPDSPEGTQIENNHWHSSIWSPPAFNYSQEMPTNVEVPPMTLSPLKKIDTSEASNLISPIKNLLPASANPLDPRISPYFMSKRNPVVVAPHPSELPLPSMSLTPKKNVTPDAGNKTPSENTKNLICSPVSSKSADRNSIDKINGSTPSKRSFFGKCRLAAQFNQPPSDP